MKRNQRRSAWFAIALGAAGTASPLSCTDFSERVAPPIDCTSGEGYVIDADGVGDFEAGVCEWYGVEDETGTVDCDNPSALKGPDNIHTETIISAGGAGGASAVPVPDGFCDGPRYSQATTTCEEIPEGPRCGSGTALHLEGSRNNDWGGFFGNYAIAQTTSSVAEWEGLAFWARAEPGSERSFTLELDDKYTTNIKDDLGQPVAGHESACIDEEQQGTAQATNTTGVSQSSGQVAGWVPSENGCGNPYEYHLTVTTEWKLYLVGFDEFTQKPLPNRRLEGFDRTSLRGVRVRPPKDTIIDLWIDDFGFYRKPGQLGIGGDSTDP